MRKVLVFLFPLAIAFDPDDIFPSCLEAAKTWQQDNMYDMAVNIPTPEACQDICFSDSTCKGITWLAEDAPLYPLTCFLFSNISGPTVPCENCVSGPRKCLCTGAGECEILEDNLVNMVAGVPSVEDCDLFCDFYSDCSFYTFLGEGNHMRHTCYLYKSCEIFVTDCVDCITGFSQCDLCDFEDTQLDGSCARKCHEGWASFKNSCYNIINNNNQHFDHINLCRAECNAQGGNLASIHSDEENSFIYSLLRPAKTDEQYTWLGAERVGDRIFRWEDGSDWDYENWAPGQGDDTSPSNTCVFMGYDTEFPEKWADGVCDYSGSKFDCICKMSTT